MEDIKEQIGLKNELLRKAIHLSSIIIPLSYYFLERNLILFIVGIGTAFMILLDIFRKLIPAINKFYVNVMGFVLRKKEIDVKEHFLTGGTYYAIGVFLPILIFKREIAVPAIMIMIICDSFAAIIGKKFGKRIFGNKSLEGSLVFFITGIAIVLLTPKITGNLLEYVYALVALLIATIVEALPIKIDDNIAIPLTFGIVYTLFLYFL